MSDKKNIVFILDVKLDGDGRYNKERSNPYHYSINSWKHWCNKNNCDIFVLEDLLIPIEEMSICWQRYYLFDILKHNNINYDQVLMVDADTIVHPNCPNFFNKTEHKYCGVHNSGSYDWILRSIENYYKYILDGKMIDWWKYINGGFQIVNKGHEQFFTDIINFYFSNQDNLIKMQETFHTGTDQTPLNFLLDFNKIDVKLLPYKFNMMDMGRKELLTDDLLFTKMGWVYHFNTWPKPGPEYWMKQTYEELYESKK